MPQRGAYSRNARSIETFGLLLLLILFLSAKQPCSEMFKGNFFPPSIVNQVLKEFNISSDRWSAITADLSLQEKNVDEKVRQKAALLQPNPFEKPKKKLVIGRLYQEARFDIFEKVMKEHGIKDTLQIHDMFDQIQYIKASRIWDCYQKG